MVQYIAGGKGEGKTKKLIDMANERLKTTDGHLVFIDDDRRHIFDLHHQIRFVEAGRSLFENAGEFYGFLLGILSQNSDIKTIYIDGITNIIEDITEPDLIKLNRRVNSLSEQNEVDFVLCINRKKETLPEEIKALIV